MSATATLLPAILLVAGPTAGGKSALALRLAEETGAEIVGADSQQLYADLPILSARPNPDEMARVPHHLVGSVDGGEAWSVGRWAEAAQAVLSDIAQRGKPALVVGGTGLYLRALTHGLAAMPAVPTAARDAAEAEYAALGEAGVRTILAELDPRAAERIAVNDRQRLVRALSVARHTGRSLSDWQAESTPILTPGSWRGLVLEPERQALYQRCDARLETMAELGVMAEVAALLARGLAADLPVMKAVGLREFARAATGGISLEAALAEAKLATRHYAKRQMTWFRNQTPDWVRLASPNDAVSIAS